MPRKMQSESLDKIYLPMYMLEIVFIALNVYFFCYGFWAQLGLSSEYVDAVLDRLCDTGIFKSQYTLKVYVFVCIVVTNLVRHENEIKTPWKTIIIILATGLVLFLMPYIRRPGPYVFNTVAGFILTHLGFSMAMRKGFGNSPDLNDMDETFEQNTAIHETCYSINIPFKFQYKKKKRKGYIDVVLPSAGGLVMGLPGTGKSYSIYTPYIRSCMEKAFTCYCYDFKFPELTKQLYNEYLLNKDKYVAEYGKPANFVIINYDDPRYSMRCNPMHPRYINDPSDTAEIADLIMKNVSPGSRNKQGDHFFDDSAKIYLDGMIWTLRCESGGRYCTFPHLIELMGRDYNLVFQLMEKNEEAKIKMRFFEDALKGNAQDQLQGQIASARAPLMRFASKDIYWILSGDDVDLNINDPKSPSILCVGNNPQKQNIFGTTNALITSRLFRQINVQHRAPCACLIDEFPTIFIDGIDTLIATARSNLVCILLGAQDREQIIRDYGRENAGVVFNTVGNVFCGRLNGDTAKMMAEMFGREFREQKSYTTGGDTDTTNTSQHQLDILPQSKIASLSRGVFFGRVADGKMGKAPDVIIKKKLFLGEVEVDSEHYLAVTKNGQPIPKQTEEAFGLKALDAKAAASPRATCIDYLEQKIRDDENERALKMPAGAFVFSEESYVKEKAAQQYDAMEDDEKGELLRKAIDRLELKRVDEVLTANRLQIIKDIDQIFLNNGIDPYGNDDDDIDDDEDDE